MSKWDIDYALALKGEYNKKQLYKRFHGQIVDTLLDGLYGLFQPGKPVELWAKQDKIIRSLANVKIIRGKRRTGKSFNVGFETCCIMFFAGLFDYPVHIKFAGPRTKDTRHMWRYFNMFWEYLKLWEVFPALKPTYDNLKNPSTDLKRMLWGGLHDSWIETSHCDDPRMSDIRGDWHDFIPLDEFGMVAHKEAFIDAATYSLKDSGPLNMLWIYGSPDVTLDINATFDRLIETGSQEGRGNKIGVWEIKGEENPYSDPEDEATAKILISEEGYLREGCGEPIPIGGRMFGWDKRAYGEELISFDPQLPLIVGIDHGFKKPAIIFAQIFNGNEDGIPDVFVFDEVTGRSFLIDELITEISLILESECQKVMPIVIGSDPAGDALSARVTWTEYQKLRQEFPMTRYTNAPALISKGNQVAMLQRLIRAGRLHVSSKCKGLSASLLNAMPDINLNTGAINSAGWKKIKGIDDPLDALAYGLINYAPTANLCMIKIRDNRTFDTKQLLEVAGMV